MMFLGLVTYLRAMNIDPFKIEDEGVYIHIRVQQRNGKKSITTVQGIPEMFDLKRILKFFKKDFACNGAIVDDKEGQVIQLSGDQREKVATFLHTEEIAKKNRIKVHGF